MSSIGGGCGCVGGNGAYPVCHGNAGEEQVSSWLNNLTLNLFGTVTKSLSPTGQIVWTAGCNPFNGGITNYPINAGEGYICYVMRILNSVGWIFQGTYNGALGYSFNSVVIYGNSLYIAIQAVPAGTFPTNASYWTLLMTAPPGPAGPAGPSGTPTRAVRVTTIATSATNSDDLIYCNPAANIALTLAAYGTYTAGKYFTIENGSAFLVTVTTSGADTIVNAANVAASTFIVYPYSSVTLYSNNDGTYRLT